MHVCTVCVDILWCLCVGCPYLCTWCELDDRSGVLLKPSLDSIKEPKETALVRCVCVPMFVVLVCVVVIPLCVLL